MPDSNQTQLSVAVHATQCRLWAQAPAPTCLDGGVEDEHIDPAVLAHHLRGGLHATLDWHGASHGHPGVRCAERVLQINAALQRWCAVLANRHSQSCLNVQTCRRFA